MISKALVLGDKVEISRLKFNMNETYKNKQVYSSILQDIKDNELIITAPVNNGKITLLEIGAVYVLSIYTKNGVYKCKSSVKSRYKKKDLNFIILELKSELTKSQRRQYYRLECVLPIFYNDNNDDIWNRGLLIDISGGGLRFISNKKLNIREIIECKLDLDTDKKNEQIIIKGNVLFSNVVDYETMRYETRIKFCDISDVYREKIIKFIFEKERIRRKRKKGL